MHQHAHITELVDMVAVDFDIVNGFGGRAVVDRDDFNWAVIGAYEVTDFQLAKFNPVFFLDRPDWVWWGAGDDLASF